MQVKLLSGALGAEISGVHLQDTSDKNFEVINSLLLEHKVIFFRNQNISPEEQLKLASRFGPIEQHAYVKGLDNYPKIILYKQRPPYEPKFGSVKSGYMGALKMTILEEIIHSVQNNLQRLNKEAVIQVNEINEELAKTILELDDKTASQLSEYLQLQSVPEEFVIAKRANLFFMLNPDTFITNVLGPDIMTYNKVDIDPKILEFIPSLLEIYQRWLKPIQAQHAVFTTMEGMAEFVVQSILKNDPDFQNYLSTFIGTDYSAYSVKKSIGKEFTEKIFETFGKDTFIKLETNPPNTRELKDPQLYLNRIK